MRRPSPVPSGTPADKRIDRALACASYAWRVADAGGALTQAESVRCSNTGRALGHALLLINLMTVPMPPVTLA